ncbi:hypothetical protein [Pseudaquidulcibacter saccharophilus]|uniref:hypothetical protein n=1 Tax=Pseudaquidulcibacter saccharophilus TaxID=2831900 RepID=UPI001EFF101F|nr:hypothetical protein [Pseudaquidulcibacter saccharophilus]
MKKLPSFTSIIGILLLVVAIVGAVMFYYAKKYAEIGAGLMAKQMCSCLYVQNRDENQCLAEMNVTLGKHYKSVKLVYMSETVFASASGMSVARAALTPGYGCSVSKFDGQMPNAVLK